MGRSTFKEKDDIFYEHTLDNLESIPDEEALKRSGATTVHVCCLGYTEPPCLSSIPCPLVHLHLDPSVIMFFFGGGLMTLPQGTLPQWTHSIDSVFPNHPVVLCPR